MESLPLEHPTTEHPTAWELRFGEEPHQTSALTGNFLHLTLTHSSFQDPGSFAKFAFALSEVARLLWFLHQNRIVHRNLTPEHILLADKAVTLIGLLPPPVLEGASSLDAAFIGTPGYAPPEQVRGEQILEPKSDIFSLGAVIYEALTNQRPFQGTGMALKLATIEGNPLPIRKLSPHCPASLISLCDFMLSKDPDLRPNAEEVQQQLLAIAKESPELHIPLFAAKRNLPASAPTPPKTEAERSSAEEQLNRLFPLQPPLIQLQPFDTRSPGSAKPMTPKGRYAFGRELGQGGIGKVSQAHDQRLQRPVAIKELLNPDNIDAKGRFLREALLTARLQHPAIVPIYDVGVRPTGEVFYSMRLISGKPLDEAIKDKPFYERLALLPHLLTVAEAIAYAHSQKIIHRDLKPHNILIGEFGETFVIDWGSAKDLTERDEPPKAEAPKTQIEVLAAQEAMQTPGLTLDGSIIGTPAYMAPEQAMGKHAKETSDVYALGAILYHLLADKAPVRDEKKLLMLQVQDGAFTPLRDVEPQTPDELLAIVQKAMAKDPEARYPTALSFADDLRRYQRGQLIYAHKYSLQERFFKYVKQHKQAFAVGTAAVVLMATGGTYSIQQIVQEKNATQRSLNDLTLLQARNELNTNPAKSIAWIKRLPPDYHGLDKARIIASDAVRRGIPLSMEGHRGRVNVVTYSPNEETIASAGSDGTIRIWNPKTRQNEKTLRAGSGVIHFEYSHDGALIAATYIDGAVRVWNVARETVQAELRAPEGYISFCTFSPDAKMLATTGESATFLWDLATQERTEVFRSKVLADNIQFSPDGKTLASAVWTSEKASQAQLYSIAERSVQTLSTDQEVEFLRVQFSQSGRFLAAAGYGGDLYLWDLSHGTSRRLNGHQGNVIEITFSTDETKLASSGQDKTIQIWDTTTGDVISSYKEHKGSVFDIEFSNNNKLLASVSGDKTVQIWNLENNQHRILKRHEDIVTSIDFSIDDKNIVSGSFDSSVLLWEAEPNSRKILFQQKEPVFAVAVSDDGSVVAAQKNRRISVWSTNDYQEQDLGPLQNLAISMAFSPKKGLLAVGDEKGIITIFDLQQKKSKQFKGHTDIIQKIKFTDETTLVSASNDKSIKAWDVNSSQQTKIFIGHSDLVTSFDISSNNKLLFSTGIDKTIKIWDIQSEKLLKSIDIHNVGFDISLSNNNFLLAVATPSSAVHAWKLSSLLAGETTPLFLEGHDDLVTRLAFIGDSSLLSASGDSTIRLWGVGSQESSVWFGHTGMVAGLAVAREAKIAISGSVDGSVLLWWENVPEEAPEFLQWLQEVPSATIPDTIVP